MRLLPGNSTLQVRSNSLRCVFSSRRRHTRCYRDWSSDVCSSDLPYFLTQKLLPLLADGGAIVNTTSNSALPSGLEPGYSAYATMKGGLAVLTQYLASELSGRGIRVNAVAPGPTRTRIAHDAFDRYPEVIPPIVERTALRRLGEADDLGKVIAALLSNEFGWVTAQNLETSGGFNLPYPTNAPDAVASHTATTD